MSYQTIQICRQELYDQVWSEPMTILAERYGLSDVGLAKICRRLNVPRPGRGYWEKKRRGRVRSRPSLPALKHGQESTAVITRREKLAVDTQQSSEAQTLIASEMRDENRIHVLAQLAALHPLVARTEKSLRSAKPDDGSLLEARAKDCLDVRVSLESVDRAVRIMDALLKALEARGLAVAVKTDPKRASTVSVLGETLEFGLEEGVTRKEHVPTAAEQEKRERDHWFSLRIPRYDVVPTGKLSVKIKNLWLHGIRVTWADGKVQRVEESLNAFVVGLINAAVQKRADRIEGERRKREWEEERRRREENARLVQEEKERLQALESEAEHWHKSQKIRAYIEAVRNDTIKRHGNIPVGSDLERWLVWASQQADRLDPLTESPPSILDEKDNYYPWELPEHLR